MTSHAAPSSDPADDDSLAGVLRATFRKFMQQTDDMLPAVVIAYDRTKNRATVAPCIAVLTTRGETVPRAQVASVPVMQFGGGGVVLNFNLKPGDLGWIKASDRDLSLFLQSFKAGTKPNTLRMHTFQDGVFIPEVMRGWTIQGEDADNAVLQTLDGNARVAVGPTFVKATFGAQSFKLSAAGVEITADSSITMQAPTITLSDGTGKVFSVGGGLASGVNVTGGVTFDGIGFNAHKHNETGSITGGPHN
jgi:hypothetical protein